MKRDNQLSNIKRFAVAVDSGKYRSEKEITSAIRCASGIGTAFKNLGLIFRSRNGHIYRNWSPGQLPIESIQKEYYRLRKEITDKAKQRQAEAEEILYQIIPQKAPLLPDTPEGLSVESRSFVDSSKSAGISPKVQTIDFEFSKKEPITLAEAIACVLAAGGTVVFGDKTNKP